MKQNATRTDIIALLHDGHSNLRISRELHCDKARVARIRRELGLPDHVPTERTRTVEEKWHTFARPTDNGHVEWLGERATGSGTPVMRHKEQPYSPAAVAFRIRHGRDAVGYAIADCGRKHCVAPDHVEDEAGRRRNREQLRYLTGGRERPPQCVHGHDQAEHGRYAPDGTAYCARCNAIRKHAGHQAVTA
ncbi:hypothetical protein AB0J38_26055 [Streptomyces sp. NPDC050095]|uniref:hypothetical protein n=1 Tax=unclassified Streptomyces TaxID=2593676 RepID=UPI0034249CC2